MKRNHANKRLRYYRKRYNPRPFLPIQRYDNKISCNFSVNGMGEERTFRDMTCRGSIHVFKLSACMPKVKGEETSEINKGNITRLRQTLMSKTQKLIIIVPSGDRGLVPV